MKAIHKRTDAYHIFLIPRLCSPLWLRMLYKVSDIVFEIPAGSWHWPSNMHKPLLIGISLPLLTRNPWTLRGTPLLVGLERELHQAVKKMEGIFCANFCKPRGNGPPCWNVWHANCYACLGQGKFPLKEVQDKEGN